MDIFSIPAEKEAVVSQMNYIYPFTKNFVVIRLNQARIKIPEELEESDICTSEKKLRSDPVTSTASFSSPTVQNPNEYVYAHN